MRKKLVIGGLVAAIAILAGAAVLLLDVNRYRDLVQQQLEGQLGRKVTLGTMTLGLIPFRLEVAQPAIAEDPAFGAERPFVAAEKLDVRVSLSSLLRGNVDIRSIELARPAFEIIRDKRGLWNYSTLGAGGAPKQDSPQAKQDRELAIGQLVVRDGRVSVTDLRRPEARTVYDHIDITTQLAAGAAGLAAKGNMKLNAARFNGVDIGYPIAADYDILSKAADGLLTINSAEVLFGQTPVSIAGTITMSSTPPEMNLSMKTGDVTIDELARLASAFGIAFAPGTTVTGRVNADVQATGSSSSPTLNGKIGARDLRISGKQVPQPVEIKTVDLALSPKEIRSNDFTLTSGKTNVSARFAVRQYTSKSPFVDLALRAPGATLPEIQSLGKAYGLTGLDQLKGDGKLNLDLHAAGSVDSLQSKDVLRALNGSMNLDFSALRIDGFNVAEELGVIGGFLNGASESQPFTDILKLTGQILVKNGIAQSDDLKAETALGILAAAGTADLVSETLNLKLSAVLSKESTEKVGAGRVAGYMRTALTNSEGQLVVPAIVTGSFRKPKFSPDTQAIVQMQKQKLIPGYKPGQKPVETIKGILGGLFGGKK
jgi:uncharacterized protein involved in outer membrane biogenesis